MINFINEDLLDGFKQNGDVLFHQANCMTGNNVSGVAYAIYRNFPTLAAVAEEAVSKYEPTDLYGRVTYVIEEVNGRETLLFNLYGQYSPGGCKGVMDSFENRYLMLYNAILNAKNYITTSHLKDRFYGEGNPVQIYMPLMGSGLGSSDSIKQVFKNDLSYFQIMLPMLKQVFENTNVVLNICYL